MADVFMNWLVDNVTKIGCSLHILCRYVDDIFRVFDFKREDGSILISFKQSPFKRKFFKRSGSKRAAAYLDVLLTNTEAGIETAICRKSTHTRLYNKWESLSPIQHEQV